MIDMMLTGDGLVQSFVVEDLIGDLVDPSRRGGFTTSSRGVGSA
jgi:hypothetical protein